MGKYSKEDLSVSFGPFQGKCFMLFESSGRIPSYPEALDFAPFSIWKD